MSYRLKKRGRVGPADVDVELAPQSKRSPTDQQSDRHLHGSMESASRCSSMRRISTLCFLLFSCALVAALFVVLRRKVLYSTSTSSELGSQKLRRSTGGNDRSLLIPIANVRGAIWRAEAAAESWIRGHDPGSENVIEMDPPVIVDPDVMGKAKARGGGYTH